MTLPLDFGVSLSASEFEDRFLAMHKQLFASTEFSFDDVTKLVLSPSPGMALWDHSFISDGSKLHLFYGMGDTRLEPEWIRRFHIQDWPGAGAVGFGIAMGHAVGTSLFDLKFVGRLEPPSQGRFDVALRDHGSLFHHNGRYGLLYDVRGGDEDNELFIGMSLAWSDDLEHWEQDDHNPCLGPPSWARQGSTCKDPHVMCVDELYLIYHIVMDRDGYCCVALATTDDWRTFNDEGSVFRTAPMLRGTLGVESPCVVRRDGIWHLFFTYGPGVWHTFSPSPRHFVHGREGEWNVGNGFYYLGPFHATEILEHDGKWWLTTTRKEESRRQNRLAGRLCYRGTYEDEKVLEEGLYLSSIIWEGDQPICQAPRP